MIVEMDVDAGNASVDIRPVSNCVLGEDEGLVVNLHPEFTVPVDQLHQDLAFPWLQHTVDISKVQDKMLDDTALPKTYEEAKEILAGMLSPIEGWAIIKKAWSLTNNERHELAKLQLEQYEDHHFDSPHELKFVLFHFCAKRLGPVRRSIFENAAEHIANIHKRQPVEFQRFRDFYVDELHSEHFRRYFDVMSEYFRDFSEFSQTLSFAQYELPIPEKGSATSSSFKRTKMFYGNAFEALAANFLVLACLNNVDKGRPYDQFEKMDLKKYLTTNKAGRGNPFKDIPSFHEFARGIDSTLRNASHHGAIRIHQKSGTLMYKSGGTGAQRTMPYSRYLYECNEIMFRLLALLMVELAITG